MDTELEAECRACDGEGTIEHPHMPLHDLRSEAPEYAVVDCEECAGSGWIIQCDRGGVGYRFSYCEAAYERQEADKMENG